MFVSYTCQFSEWAGNNSLMNPILSNTWGRRNSRSRATKPFFIGDGSQGVRFFIFPALLGKSLSGWKPNFPVLASVPVFSVPSPTSKTDVPNKFNKYLAWPCRSDWDSRGNLSHFLFLTLWDGSLLFWYPVPSPAPCFLFSRGRGIFLSLFTAYEGDEALPSVVDHNLHRRHLCLALW